MGGSISSETAFSGSVGLKSCLYTISSEELHPRNEQNSYNNMEKTVKERLPIENLEFSTSSSEEEKEADDNDILPDKFFSSLIEGIEIPESNPGLADIDECNTLMIQLHPFDVDASNDLNKLASGLLHLHLPSDEDGEAMEMENTYLKEETLSYVRTLLTTPSKLPSAIKGSRSQKGDVMNVKMSVKWAADVYDPPVTSSSHTIKGRHRPHHHSHNYHLKSKKDYYTSSKYSKGKSSRGGSKEKHSHRKSSRHSVSTNPQISRIPALECRKTMVSTCIEPKVEPRDEEVHSKESIKKFGSSCYMETMASLPLAVAKVS